MPITKLSYQEVFVPGGYPKHTYNARTSLNLKPRLEEARGNLCKLVTVTGQTKSGKTILAKKIFPKDASVWVDGGSVGTDEEFWQIILDQLDSHQAVTQSSGQSRGGELATAVKAEAGVLLARASGEASGKFVGSRQNAESRTRTVSSRTATIRALQKSSLALIIDDFHYIKRDLQAEIVRALKPLVFEGNPVVVIAIPHRRYDALKVEKEMTGRIAPIEVDSWSSEELEFIPRRGFELLGSSLNSNVEKRLSEQALESPHLMQEFCRGICKRLTINSLALPETISEQDVDFESIFRDIAETIGKPIFEKLARGPRSRTDRVPRKLKSGITVDIYGLVLHALAELKPALVSLEYEDLRSAIKEVSEERTPQMQEVVRVLKQMATIASSDAASTPVIDFEEQDQKLHVTDLFFAFYLRWGSLQG